jgi:hypothetical protein
MGTTMNRVDPLTLSIDSGQALSGTPTRLVAAEAPFQIGTTLLPAQSLPDLMGQSFQQVSFDLGLPPPTLAYSTISVGNAAASVEHVAMYYIPGNRGYELTDFVGLTAGAQFVATAFPPDVPLTVEMDGRLLHYVWGDQRRYTARLGSTNVAPRLRSDVRRLIDHFSVSVPRVVPSPSSAGRLLERVRRGLRHRWSPELGWRGGGRGRT